MYNVVAWEMKMTPLVGQVEPMAFFCMKILTGGAKDWEKSTHVDRVGLEPKTIQSFVVGLHCQHIL